MLEILKYIVSTLKGASAVTSIVPSTNIFVGPVDVVTESQSELLLPQINIHVISESVRTVPINTRDTIIQIDIWSRNSQLEVVQAYEAIMSALNYQSPTQDTAKIFWERLNNVVDQYESDRRIFHRSMTFAVWSQKPM